MKAKEELPYYFDEATECELVQGTHDSTKPAGTLKAC